MTYIKVLSSLAKNPNLEITKPDKGNGLVLMDKVSYVNKMNHILNDPSNFTALNGDKFSSFTRCQDKVTG